MSPKSYSYPLELMKFILILGVILIHCNFTTHVSIEEMNPGGRWIVTFISGRICSVAVPCFFIISGYLYFLGSKDFSKERYLQKSKKRIHTLLIPYLIWNTVALILQLIKCTFLGYPSHGLISSGHLDFLKLAEGFWNFQYGYPYAFAFWFIRNLMVFCILAPFIRLISSRLLLLGLFIVGCTYLSSNFYMLLYFATGAALGLRNVDLFSAPFRSKELVTITLLMGLGAWIGISIMEMKGVRPPFSLLLELMKCGGAFIFICGICKGYKPGNKFISELLSSTFFLYAFHQLFVSLTHSFYIRLFGITTVAGVIAVYLSTFLTLLFISYGVWKLLLYFSPRLLKILCGGRLQAADRK